MTNISVSSHAEGWVVLAADWYMDFTGVEKPNDHSRCCVFLWFVLYT